MPKCERVQSDMKRSFFDRGFFVGRTGAPDRSAFAAALALLVTSFIIVGGARDDILSLLVWRPLSAMLLVLAVVSWGARAWSNGKALLQFSLAVALLVTAHLVPLPPAVWTTLPGREIIAEVYRSAGMPLSWQPLSVAQARTWNALFSLAGPFAILVVALTLDRQRHRQLLLLLLGLGFLSGIIGMVQAIGPTNGALYFYRISNHGLSVGLFANRNHQAAFLATMYPLLAANLSLFRGRPDKLFFQRAVTLAGACLLVPLILMTGSRAGIVLAAIGMMFAWWVYCSPVAKGRVVGVRSEHRSRLVGIAVAIFLLLVVLVVAISTPALQRLVETDPASELRVQALPVIAEAARYFFPFGSGIGTFVEAYQIFEPDALITTSYFNHAHNEFAELLMTGGVPAILLLIWALVLGAKSFLSLLRRRKCAPEDADFPHQVLGRAGFAVLVMLALASATDYPLRVPSLMIFATVAAIWCLNAYRFTKK